MDAQGLPFQFGRGGGRQQESSRNPARGKGIKRGGYRREEKKYNKQRRINEGRGASDEQEIFDVTKYFKPSFMQDPWQQASDSKKQDAQDHIERLEVQVHNEEEIGIDL